MNDGSRQEDRIPAGLGGLGTLADDRRLEDLLAATRDYAAQLKFADGSKQTNETWAGLLDRDESFLLARLLTIPVRVIERNFLDDFDAGRIENLAATVDRLERFLLDWAALVEPTHQGHRIEALKGDLSHLLTARSNVVRLAVQSKLHHDPQAHADEKQLRAQFFALTQQVRSLQQLARERFPQTLATEQHEPASGLLLALHRTHGRIQDKLNQFPDRLVDFYYHDCLGFDPRTAQPDKVHLTFRRDPNSLLQVVVPKGQLFEAASQPDGGPIRFVADSQLTVTDARVAAVYTLRSERDPLISPECLFGFATRLMMADITDTISRAAGEAPVAHPVFGGKQPGTVDREIDAPIGLAIAAPILGLAQGERTISVEFGLRVESTEQIARALQSATERGAFTKAFGSLFVSWLLLDEIGNEEMTELVDLAHRVGEEQGEDGFLYTMRTELRRTGHEAQRVDELLALMLDPLNDAKSGRPQEVFAARRRVARNLLFPKFFKVEVSAPSGWLAIPDALPLTGPDEAFRNRSGDPLGQSSSGRFGLRLSLGPSDPAIVPCTALHGEDWPGDAPVLRLTLNRLSRIFGLSIFDHCQVETISVEVDVEGLREFELHNQLGQIDPSKPFLPFGPMPDTSAYLIIDSPEIAAKNISQYTLQFEWAGLPTQGFAEHYRGYPVELKDNAFAVAPAILRDGTWLQAGEPQPLFRGPVGSSPPLQDITIPSAQLIANWRNDLNCDRFGPGARNGFCKLQFAAPEDGFGERLYASALADSMRAKPSRHTRQPKPPVAPRVTQLTLRYQARSLIRIGQEGNGEHVLHLHPLGRRVIHPVSSSGAMPTLFPKMGGDGQLLIGLDGEQVEGDLTLLFDLAPDTTIDFREASLLKVDIAWEWLSENGWEPLDKWRVKHDATMNFRRSGIVSLELPQKLPRINSFRSGKLGWIRISTNATSNRFAVLRGVTAQALTATRVSPVPVTQLAANSLDSRSASIPGILAIAQPLPGFGLRAPETKDLERTRIGERLRHKNRASFPWDYERLVLEAFPQVHKVKCLPSTSAKTYSADEPGKPLPESVGKVLVVVVPMSPEGVGYTNDRDTRPLGIDACEIGEICKYLSERSSPFADVEVISATFEQIQVRCHIELKDEANVGTVLQEVNHAIVSFISPWADTGLGPDFDWSINSDDIYEAIRTAHTDIAAVKGVTVIRVWEDDRYPLDESARRVVTYLLDDNGETPEDLLDEADGRIMASRASTEIRASRPWSLPLPLSRHIIQIVGKSQQADTYKTGIAAGRVASEHSDSVAGLQIGETFIVDP